MTDTQLLTDALQIKVEVTDNANSATRIGTMLENIINSKPNNSVITTIQSSIQTEAIRALAAEGILQTSVATKQATLGFTPENIVNKSVNVLTDSTSDVKYPSAKAVATYADSILVGLLQDMGNYNASTNLFPATGGSGAAGAVNKGDLWYISTGGTLSGTAVLVGYSIRALINVPGQTGANWAISNVGLGFVPENVTNKSTDGTLIGNSDTLYPSQKAVKTYVDGKVFSGGGSSLKTFLANISSSENVLTFSNVYNTLGFAPVPNTYLSILGRYSILDGSFTNTTTKVFVNNPNFDLKSVIRVSVGTGVITLYHYYDGVLASFPNADIQIIQH